MASPRIRAPKDFGAGILYLALGAAGFFMALDYGVGSLARMGSGFFPLVLSDLLALFGAASLARSFMKPGEPIGGFGWKGLILVIAGTVAFGLLIRPAGLVVSLAVLMLASAAASARLERDLQSLMARWRWWRSVRAVRQIAGRPDAASRLLVQLRK